MCVIVRLIIFSYVVVMTVTAAIVCARNYTVPEEWLDLLKRAINVSAVTARQRAAASCIVADTSAQLQQHENACSGDKMEPSAKDRQIDEDM